MESCFMAELIEFLVRVVDARLDGLNRYGILKCFLIGLGGENWGSSLGLNGLSLRRIIIRPDFSVALLFLSFWKRK